MENSQTKNSQRLRLRLSTPCAAGHTGVAGRAVCDTSRRPGLQWDPSVAFFATDGLQALKVEGGVWFGRAFSSLDAKPKYQKPLYIKGFLGHSLSHQINEKFRICL